MNAYECWYQLACREDSKVIVLANSYEEAVGKFGLAAYRLERFANNDPPDLQMIRLLQNAVVE